ncbi:hypothetical protein [Clostridium gasigenes]|uniref:hypothetical protein n=1 Tax=Clostridium gasigenes TaxID=94869 RepID=UPI001C0DF009|nr:hypothetical protein [Clostridium gasigenes]MBU3103923.1 hypothetical protein [Clostridium gasigenes]
MVFTKFQADMIYNELYDWIAVHTPGSHCYKSVLKKYQEKVWNPTIEAVDRLSNKSDLNKEEQEFLKLVLYSGPIYRIQNYNPRKKGYVCENSFYQSWSQSIDGVNNIPNINGTVLLIVGNALNAINIFGLLEFLFKYNNVTLENNFKEPTNLLMYEEEQEIAYPVQFNHVKEIATVDKVDLYQWENYKVSIPKEKWGRNNMN